MSSTDAHVKLAEMLTLTLRKESKVHDLTKAIRDPSTVIRNYAERVLCEQGGWLAAGLDEALKGGKPSDGWLGTSGTGSWVVDLGQLERHVGRKAAAILAGIDVRVAVLTDLLTALGDDVATVRESAAEALVRAHDDRLVAPLLVAFFDASPKVRYFAARALSGKYEDPRIEAALRTALENRDFALIAGGCARTVELGVMLCPDALVAALGQFPDLGLAKAMVESRDLKLSAYGKAWIARNYPRDPPSQLARNR